MNVTVSPRLDPWTGKTTPKELLAALQIARGKKGLPTLPPTRPEGGFVHADESRNKALRAWTAGYQIGASWEPAENVPQNDVLAAFRLEGWQAGRWDAMRSKIDKEVEMSLSVPAGNPQEGEFKFAHEVPPSAMHTQPHEIEAQRNARMLSTREAGHLLNLKPGDVRKLIGDNAFPEDAVSKKGTQYQIRHSAVMDYKNSVGKQLSDAMDSVEVKASAELPIEPDPEVAEAIVQELTGDPRRFLKNMTHGSQRIVSALNYAHENGLFLRYAYGRQSGQREPNWYAANGLEYTIVESIELVRYKDQLSVDPTKSKVKLAHDGASRYLSGISHVELLI